MNYFAKRRVGFWGVIVLLTAFNIGTLIYVWMLPKHRPPGPPSPQFDPVTTFLIREMGLNEEQQKALRLLRQQHFEVAGDIQRNILPDRRTFFAHFSHAQVDTSEIKRVSVRISEGQQRLEWEMFWHFRAIRSLCHPEQQIKFDQVVFDALRIMAPPPPGALAPR